MARTDITYDEQQGNVFRLYDLKQPNLRKGISYDYKSVQTTSDRKTTTYHRSNGDVVWIHIDYTYSKEEPKIPQDPAKTGTLTYRGTKYYYNWYSDGHGEGFSDYKKTKLVWQDDNLSGINATEDRFIAWLEDTDPTSDTPDPAYDIVEDPAYWDKFRRETRELYDRHAHQDELIERMRKQILNQLDLDREAIREGIKDIEEEISKSEGVETLSAVDIQRLVIYGEALNQHRENLVYIHQRQQEYAKYPRLQIRIGNLIRIINQEKPTEWNASQYDWTPQLIDSYIRAYQNSDESYLFDQDISYRIEQRLLPYIQKLDDLGLLRTITFMLGGIAGYMMDDAILKDFGQAVEEQYKSTIFTESLWDEERQEWYGGMKKKLTKVIPAHNSDTVLSKALSWSSRWFAGVPMYEVLQKGLYPEERTFSTPTQGIYWMHEFWGTKKYFKIPYWNLENYDLNYKRATLSLRNYLYMRGHKLNDIGEYSQYH